LISLGYSPPALRSGPAAAARAALKVLLGRITAAVFSGSG
jgi:hypothetical protein